MSIQLKIFIPSIKFNISDMLNPAVYDHHVESIQLIETHISWVILTGDYAYKIKKPLNFGFLDFSTLQKRKEYCKKEVRLNQKLTTKIYLDVVQIVSQQNNQQTDHTNVIEYAIKMTQFPQSAQLDNMLTAGELSVRNMDEIAKMVANFHQHTQIAGEDSSYANPENILQPVEENFNQIMQHLTSSAYDERLKKLNQWNENRFESLNPLFKQRKQQGFIRECHGDMHLQNLLWIDGTGPMAFDCIEFNENLRWIDVISEIAFLVMDLHHRQQFILANRFLNSYLEITGDYAGLTILPFYLCYRSMVRAKVALLRIQQPGISATDKNKLIEEFESYLKLAEVFSHHKMPKLIIMRGVSASGKSTVSQKLVDHLGTIRLRSDVERKRLTESNANTKNNINSGIYSEKVTEQTYTKLLDLTSGVIEAGFSTVVDAAFLNPQQRKPFQETAKKLNTPFFIIDITAPADVLRQRLLDRKNDVSDADLDVLEHQLSSWQPLLQHELKKAISINSLNPGEIERLIKEISLS